MATYQITLNAEQEKALTWCLAQKREQNPDEAPEDRAALLLALVRDRVGQVVRQHDEALAADDTEVQEALKDRAKLLKVRQALGLPVPA